MRQVRALAILGGLIFVAFWIQRERSPFLQIEADGPVNERLAAAAGLELFDLMALRHVVGVDLGEQEFVAIAQRFAVDRDSFGSEDLAVVAAVGHRELAERLRAEYGADVRAAETALRARLEGVDAVRFREVRARLTVRAADRARTG